MARQVAVIGAGAAGLKAAFDLLADKHEVTVYEALSRAGGRTFTVELGRQAVDLGAESLEGGMDSPWLAEFVQKNVEIGPLLKDPLALAKEHLYWLLPGEAEGYAVAPEAAASAYLRLLGTPDYEQTQQGIDENIERARQALDDAGPTDRSLRALDASNVAAAHGVDLGSPQRRLTSNILHTGPFSESVEPTAYSAMDRSRQQSAGEDVRPVKGVGTLFEEYARQLQLAGATLRYKTQVSQIERADTGHRWLVSHAGQKQAQAFDAVVVTVALPVIATSQLFFADPDVGRTINAAMDGIGLGHYLKVGVFWPEAAKTLGEEAYRAYAGSSDGSEVWQLDKLAGSQVLVAAAAGQHALRLTRLGRQGAIAEAVAVIRTLTGSPYGQPATKTMLWSSDAAFGGAYSYSAPQAGLARPELAKLAQTLREQGFPGLYFAGEAFSLDQYGNLDGAYLTAVQAAANCRDYLGSLSG